jgi:hypothetical protein
MANACPTPIHVCRARFTRLVDSTGVVAAAPNNHVVTDAPMEFTITPVISEGDDIELKGGCDCVCVSYKGRDRLKRFDLAIQLCKYEPALVELLTGAALFTNGSAEPIGNVWPIALGCATTGQPPVAVELWSDNYEGDAPSAAANRYTRWVFPRSFWQWDEITLNNEFTTPSFNGWSQSNTAWANPYNDLPTGVTSAGGASGTGGAFFDDGPLPTVVCGYSTFST